MIPWEVGSDPRLTHRDVRVYFALAASRRGPEAKIGVRRIAEGSHVGFRHIGVILGKLAALGYVQIHPGKRGQRARYRLMSPLFASKVGTLPSGPIASRPARILVACPKCGDRCKGLLRVGYCRSCNWELKVRKISRDEIEKAAS